MQRSVPPLVRRLPGANAFTRHIIILLRFGDTLSAIAMRYRTTWQRLATYNHIANANLIFPGQQVCIPGKASRGGTGSSGSPGGPRQDFVSLARQDALNVGFSPNIFVRQINQESGFNPSAISPAGALGIAQFEPATAASLGVNPWDPVQSLQGASRLMASYIRQFGGDIAKALAAYNAGPGAVQRAVRIGGTSWRAFLPAETQNYIRVILG